MKKVNYGTGWENKCVHVDMRVGCVYVELYVWYDDMFMPTIKCRLMTSSCLLYLHMSTNDELQLLGESYFLSYKTCLLIRETGELYAR